MYFIDCYFGNSRDGYTPYQKKDHLAGASSTLRHWRGSLLHTKSTCNHLGLCMGNKTDGRIHLSPSILRLHLCFSPLYFFFLRIDDVIQVISLLDFKPSHNSLFQFGSNHVTFLVFFSPITNFFFFQLEKKQNKKWNYFID